MFITKISSKSKLNDLIEDKEYTYWDSAELLLNQAWFIVEIRQVEQVNAKESIDINRTMLLTSIDEVENLMEDQENDLLVFVAVHVVIPKKLGGSAGWQMHQLESVWTAEEPKKRGGKLDIFQFQDGLRYANSLSNTPVDKLVNIALRFHVPMPRAFR